MSRNRFSLAPAATLPMLLLAAAAAHAAVPGYQYVSPVPGARLVSALNNVILREGSTLDASTVTVGRVEVSGSQSGLHGGTVAVSDDGKTIIRTPDHAFAPSETVSVTVHKGIYTLGGTRVPLLRYKFIVSPQALPAASSPLDRVWADLPLGAGPATDEAAAPRALAAGTGCALPAKYPGTTLLSSDRPQPGHLLLAPFSTAAGFGENGDLIILDDRNQPMFWRDLPTQRALEFTRLDDGRLMYLAGRDAYLMDSSYTVVDSITTGNGYTLDSHEFRLLPNGHVLLMSYDPQPVAMDTVVPGGRPDAIVEGLIIQELDQERRVVFQWRSWDSMEITDCNSGAVDLADSLIDYVHGNAIELDHDGNLLISSRHLNEITKIDRTTGEIMWRMGGNAVKNEFTFIGDTRGFSHQHDIRRLPNGHVTLFDNGNFLVPPYSRALEYELDEVAKTATLVWSYETTPPRTFGGFMGSVERHDDGATVIGWGGTFNSSRRVTDLHADGTVALEIGFPAQVFSYRAHRFPWRTTRLLAAVDTLDFGVVPYGGDPVTRTVTLSNRSAIPTAVTCVDVILSAFAADSAAFTLAPGESRDVAVTFDPRQAGAHAQRLYVRSVTDTEIVATSVELRAVTDPLTAVDTPRVTGFGLRAVRPNPVGRRGTFTFDLPASAEVRLEIFSADGRRVRTVTRGMHAAGRHEVAWNADGLAAGVYFARLASSGRASSAKFVVMERH